MKIFSLTILLGAAVLGLTGCPGNANNNGNLRTNTGVSNNAGIFNSNTAVTNSSNANMTNSMGNMANTMGDAITPNGFMTGAAYSGMAEVEAGKMAVSKTKNAEVKQFAQQMIAEHTRANNELKQLAAKKSAALPTDLDAAHKAMAENMSKLSGDEFDREYMNGQVADHEKTVALFQGQADGGTDADAKAFAAKTLPALKMHLEMARKLNGKMK